MLLKLFYVLSGLFYIFSLCWSSILGFWLSLEMAKLILVMCFFSFYVSLNRYLSLLSFMLISGVSSSLFFIGMLYSDLFILSAVSFLIKVGSVPFFTWLLLVLFKLEWGLIYIMGVVSKVSLLAFASFWSGLLNGVMLALLLITLLLVGILYWGSKVSMKSFFIYSSIGSGVVLVYFCLSGNVSMLVSLYGAYFLAYTLLINCLYLLESKILLESGLFTLMFGLLTLPWALTFLYKFVSMLVMMGAPAVVMVCWCFYSMAEQMYLTFLLLEKVSFFSV